MPNKTMDEILMNAKSVKFLFDGENKNIAIVFVIFEDMNVAVALYEEVARVNETNPQYLGFKKSHSSLILSFILEKENRTHAKMLLDFDEKEFDDFISKVSPSGSYVLLLGQIENGKRRIGGFQKNPLMFYQYLLE